MLSFQLLGPVSLYKDGQPLSQFRSQKEAALLIYLAQTGQAPTRELIADLLWEDRSTEQALSNLRTVLARLRKQVDNDLIIERKTVSLVPASQQQVDAVRLLQGLTPREPITTPEKAAALQSILNSYRGQFLVDFHLPDAPQYEQWVMSTRTAIHQQVSAAYHQLGHYALTTNDTAGGIASMRRWLQLDALDETAHMLLIRLLLKAGAVREAVAHYDACDHLLQTELGVAPSGEMSALIRSVRAPAMPQPPPAAAPRHNLPALYDQFFGRKSRQDELHARLDQPWCRLVTLVGPGGVGKTRLATTIARSRLPHYPDGVWLVELAELDREDANLAEAIAVEIATAIDLRLGGSTTPIEQLLSHLQHKALLLVLDNFEHLLEEGIPLVLDLIQRCDRVQLLVTSREALRTRAEWTVPLMGLGYPLDDNDATDTEAVDLFMARRAQGRQDLLAPPDFVAVRQICRLVEGLPLALELAAALAHTTPLPLIAEELHNGFDTLTTALRDVPERHRSLQLVFTMSWRTLTPVLQTRLAHLALFRGGFTGTAAQAIADARKDQLTALVEKSLLTYDPVTGRYALHPVVRAYAVTQLTDADTIAYKHAHYYLTLLAGQRDTLQKDAPQQAVALLEPELENVRLAWQTGLAFPALAALVEAALTPLSIVYQLRGLAHEAEATMQSTLRTVTAWGTAGIGLATHAGLERARFQNRLGRQRGALESVALALRHAQSRGDRWAEGMGHVLWGEALWRLGEYPLAVTKLTHALTVAHAIDSTLLVGWCHHHLGVIDDIQGRYAAALDHLHQACAAWQTIGNAQALSNSLNSIGLVCYHQGDFAAAQRAMAQALTLCEQIDDRHRRSSLINNLSMIATEQGDYLSAHHYLQMGLTLVRISGDLSVQGNIHTNLGRNYYLLGQLAAAEENLEQGMRILASIGNRALLATAMLYLAETTRRQGNAARTETLYGQALNIARQDNLQLIECEVLIGMAEFFSKSNECAAKAYSAQAITRAEALQHPNLLERAMAINHYLRIEQP